MKLYDLGLTVFIFFAAGVLFGAVAEDSADIIKDKPEAEIEQGA